MRKVDTKAYFLFLKYILNEFNAFNAFFQGLETRIHLLQPKSVNFLFKVCKNFLKDELLKSFNAENVINIIFSLKENQKDLHEITFGFDCNEYLNELMMQGHEDIVTTVRENCLSFYVTAAEEIRKRLPINNIFLSKLNVFRPFVSLFNNDRETSFNDVSYIVKTIGGFNEDDLKKEWLALPLDFTTEEKQSLSKKTFDEMWKKILKCQDSNNIDKYPNLKSVLNAVRSLPNSNADSERMFSFLSDLKTKKRNKLSSDTVNAICVLKSALKTRNETCINMKIEEKHLSLMSPDKLYASTTKKDQSTLKLHAVDVRDIAGPSWAD